MVSEINGVSTAGMTPEQYVYNVNHQNDNSSSSARSVGSTDNMSDMDLLKYELDYNSAEAKKDRDWQEKMSNTAYSRAFEDIKAAGYNPWLLLDRGASASTPGGSSASASSGIYSAKKQRESVKDQNAAKYAGLFASAFAIILAAAL